MGLKQPPPRFDVWVCQGRFCTAHGASRVAERAAELFALLPPPAQSRLRVLRGGCYGLCELGPNAVVRRYSDDVAAPPQKADDTLTLTGAPNETVYCGLTAEELEQVVSSHLAADRPALPLTRAVREPLMPARSEVAARIRALRSARQTGD